MNEEKDKKKILEMMDKFESCINHDDKATIVISTLLTMLASYCVATDDPINLSLDITRDFMKTVFGAVLKFKEEEND